MANPSNLPNAALEEVFNLLHNAGEQWQTSRTKALSREAEPTQRVADRLPNLGPAGMRPHKTRNGKAGLEFEPPLARDLGLIDTAELGQGRRSQKIGQAEPWIGLLTLSAGRDRRLPIAGGTMGDAESDVGYVDCSIERAPSQCPFGVIDSLHRPPGVAKDH